MHPITRILSTALTGAALTAAGWATGVTATSAQAATVESNVSRIVLTMSPAEFWAAQNLAMSPEVCGDALAKVAGMIVPDVTMDACEAAITHCPLDLSDGSWPQVVLYADHGFACLTFHPA